MPEKLSGEYSVPAELQTSAKGGRNGKWGAGRRPPCGPGGQDGALPAARGTDQAPSTSRVSQPLDGPVRHRLDMRLLELSAKLIRKTHRRGKKRIGTYLASSHPLDFWQTECYFGAGRSLGNSVLLQVNQTRERQAPCVTQPVYSLFVFFNFMFCLKAHNHLLSRKINVY